MLATTVRTTDTLPSPAGLKEFPEKRLDNMMRCCWHRKPDRRPTFEYLLKFFREYIITQGDIDSKNENKFFYITTDMGVESRGGPRADISKESSLSIYPWKNFLMTFFIHIIF